MRSSSPAAPESYLFVVADAAAGGGTMFHVSARYFQFEPSCTMTLI
jgi:hypothetical protein